MAKTANKRTEVSQMERQYDEIMRRAPITVPATAYRENLEQPSPYPHVETVTTYGVSVELD